MPRGRPRKKPPDPGPIDAISGDVIAPEPASSTDPIFPTLPDLPPQKVKGEWNPEYFAERIGRAINMYERKTLIDGESSNFNADQYTKMVMNQAKLVGVAERDVIDRRTEAQRAEDVWAKIVADPESAFGVSDDDLRALDAVIAMKESRMDSAEEQCHAVLEGKLREADDARDDRSARGPKAWRRRIQRILRLRERARSPLPKHTGTGSWSGNQWTEERDPGLRQAAIEAAHVLRFMVYVGRVGMDTTAVGQEQTPADMIYDVGPHHAKFAATLWCHRNGVGHVYDKELRKHRLKKYVVPYVGSIQIMPLAHGKTDLAINYSALEMGLNPRITGLYLHAKGDVAVQNLATVKRYLDPNTGMGQRYLSLFPCKLAKTQNDSGRIRLVVRNPPKSPTFTAAGVDSARLGIDADLQVWDDVVPQSDAEQPTERERRGRILRGTFSSRKRSRKAFTLVIGTLWHHADALAQLIDDAKAYHSHDGRQGSCYGVNIQRVGGPKATDKTKEWEVLWPGQYDAKRLREKYAELRSTLYSAAMMANPLAEEQRIVRKLRLYDPSLPEHEAFVRTSIKYISLDPSATKNSTSDKAGVVYAGFGDIRVSRTDENGLIFSDVEKRVRFFDHREIHATQYDLVEYTENFALKNDVDYILVEAVSGFAGIVEMFQNRGVDVIRKDPKGKNKEQRLRGVAPILDDSGADLGMRATAEFPGVYNEKGEFVLDPRFKELAEQILDFGVCAHDHSLDAAVYLLGELAPDLGVGRGMITRQVRVVQKEMGDPRLLEMYRSYDRANKAKQQTSEEQEHEWMKRAWS